MQLEIESSEALLEEASGRLVSVLAEHEFVKSSLHKATGDLRALDATASIAQSLDMVSLQGELLLLTAAIESKQQKLAEVGAQLKSSTWESQQLRQEKRAFERSGSNAPSTFQLTSSRVFSGRHPH